MSVQDQPDVPVYLFTGFLESGKTTFIKENVLTDPAFDDKEQTLLLVCEEGEEEYDDKVLEAHRFHQEVVENEIDLSPKILTYLLAKNHASRVVVEFNGMWQLNSFYQGMPDSWAVYQEFMFVDSTTFLNYNQNMRQLVVDKLQSCDLVIYNRFDKSMDKMMFHKIARATSRRAQIAYEYKNGQVEQDNIADPLPFNLNDPVVRVKDEDYAAFYRNITEEPKQWIGKDVNLKGIAVTSRRFDPGVFAFGRQVMTCCVQDIQFCSLVAVGDPKDPPISQNWYDMTFHVDYKFHKLYGRKGPVLIVKSQHPTSAPEQEVATVY